MIGTVPGTHNAYVATGHGCWGVLNAPVTGLSLSELIVDGSSITVDINNFDPNRFHKKYSLNDL